jgi:hypothetical protein
VQLGRRGGKAALALDRVHHLQRVQGQFHVRDRYSIKLKYWVKIIRFYSKYCKLIILSIGSKHQNEQTGDRHATGSQEQ